MIRNCRRFLAKGLFVCLTLAAGGASADTACTPIQRDMAICGDWSRLPVDTPDGISVWTDGATLGKLIVQRAGALDTVSPEQVLKTTLESIRASLEGGRRLAFETGEARAFGRGIHSTLSYALRDDTNTVFVRHTVLIEGDRILQVITGHADADRTAGHDTLLRSLSFQDLRNTL